MKKPKDRVAFFEVQEIINSTKTKTFAKELKLVKLFRRLSTRCHKKVFSHVCNAKCAPFWCFAARQHVNGCYFANIDVFFYWLA